MRSEWEEKAYINPHSSSGSRTLETDTEQDLKSFSPVSSSTSISGKCGFGGLDSPGEELCSEEEFENAFLTHPNLQPHRMSAHAVMMSHLNAMAVYRMSLAMEEFPQLLGLSRTHDCTRARSVLRMKSKFSCGRIAEEVDEEGRFAVEEDKARRSFLQSLESLRRCTQGRQ